MATKRILTGIRPTGPLHLGHKVGALDNWVRLQNEGQYECYFLIADVQGLTTHAHQPQLIEEAVREVVLDWLAIGLDPELSNVHFVLQSAVIERYELSILLQMVTPWSWVENNPTVKAEMNGLENDMVVGFPSYPVDQAADILMVAPVPVLDNNELLVPVGEDQVPHLELTRRIARRFNHMYGCKILPDCKPLIGDVGRLVGTDGNEKMSKSKNNAIYLGDAEATIKKKVNSMYTDPNKIRVTDPGNVTNHIPFKYLRVFYPDQCEIDQLQVDYERGRVGDVKIKRLLAQTLNEIIVPIYERRLEASIRTDLRDLVEDGTKKARLLTQQVTQTVREAMHLNYHKL